MAVTSSRLPSELGESVTLAPERYDPRRTAAAHATIGSLATLSSEYARERDIGPFTIVNTSDAYDGFIHTRSLQTHAHLQSSKKLLAAGDVLVSRLRPYLRQVAYVDQALLDRFTGSRLCCSTEFFVLRRAAPGSLAFLVPLMLSPGVQQHLALAVEGGHHPRVSAEVIAGIGIPEDLLGERDRISQEMVGIVAAYRAVEALRERIIAFAER